ncbi:unnamed protein product, partial [Rotaria socialis]
LIRPLGSAGPGLLWRIYGAIKRTTKQKENFSKIYSLEE